MQDRERRPGAAGEPAALIELDRRACLALLRTASIGRVIYTDSALPAAQPVTYVLDGEEIVFRSGGGGKLHTALRNTVVGFQVDELDPTTRAGWTVLGVGETYEITEPKRLAALHASLSEAWAPGPTEHTLSIPLQRLTGSRIVTGAVGNPDGPADPV